MDKAPNIENELEVERELSPEEKKTLAAAWCSVVLGRETTPENVEAFSNEQMRAWLYDSLVSEALVLRSEWGLAPDIEKYREAMEKCADDAQRSDVQFQFIDSLKVKFKSHLVANLNGAESHMRRHESWPKAMRTTKIFNCVGATLIAIASIEEAGIEVHFGDMAGHVVAFARLENGEWVYADLNNNFIKKVKPEEKSIDGILCFVLKDPDIVYETAAILDPKNIPLSVFANLARLKKDIEEERYDSDRQKERIASLHQEGKQYFDSLKFNETRDLLYKGRDIWLKKNDVSISEEWVKVYLLNDFSGDIKRLPPAVLKELQGVLLQYPQDFKDFMMDMQHPIPGISEGLKEMLVAAHQRAWHASHGNQAAINKAVDFLIFQANARAKKEVPPTAS